MRYIAKARGYKSLLKDVMAALERHSAAGGTKSSEWLGAPKAAADRVAEAGVDARGGVAEPAAAV